MKAASYNSLTLVTTAIVLLAWGAIWQVRGHSYNLWYWLTSAALIGICAVVAVAFRES